MRSHRAAAVFAALVTATLVLLPTSGASADSGSVPFTDPAAHGYIGFCDMSGHNVLSGRVDSRPFVWRAVSSVEPPQGYQGHGQNASLTIFQPRPGVAPADYSGDQVEGSSIFNNPRIPTAQATYKDLSLRDFMRELPPKLDGLYQLRMPFGKTDYGTYSATYPATVIQVTGATWHVVSGGLVDCAKAGAGSLETILNHVPVTPHRAVPGMTPTTAPVSDRAGGSTGHAPGSGATTSTTRGAGSQSGVTEVVDRPITAPIHAANSAASGGLSKPALAVIVLAALLVTGVAGVLVRRRFS